MTAWPHIQVLTATEPHWQILATVLDELHHPAGNLFFDIRTVVLMREYGIREITTADTDFLQFKEIAVRNPIN